ncbi:pyrokinin-1 receptor-like [Linepithema humile]|uniref:pyrokinin-1 receptor-like n=1 Tax=Linepithema humile TaxID=83485 RepID=UPI00062339DE|nr:PREDICTED: uncharacterized protein LOC105669407 [Linepithema humile]
MFNEHDMRAIRKYVDNPFPTFRTNPISTTNPTKMNIIIPIIPEPTRDIMDFTLVVAGVCLNIFLALIVALNSSMYTSTNCYVISLASSSLIILLEPLQQVLRWISDIDLNMNLDYIFLVTFATSILIIIQLNIETYVIICQKNSPLRKPLQKVSTAAKGILFIWVMSIMVASLELSLYEHYEKEVMHDIFVSFTVMFLIFPCFIFIMVDCFILYDLIISRSIEGTWPSEDVERFVFLVGITIGFFLTMIPYRVVRAIALVTTTCCSDITIEVVYTMVKMYPMILPITCYVISKEFRQALEMTLRCQRHETST